MKKKSSFIFLSFLLALNFSLFAEEADVNINIKISLYKGTWNENQNGIEKEVILTSSSQLDIAHLKEKTSGPEEEYIAAVMEALIETMNLHAVEELGRLKDHEWKVTENAFISTIVKKEVAFQFTLVPKRLSSQKFSLKTIINRTKDSYVSSRKEKDKGSSRISSMARGYVDKIYDRELMVNVDEPVIVGIPFREYAYFISILIPSDLGNPKPIHKVMPIYPEVLKKEGIGGEVQLKVKVNARGEVG